MSEMQVVIRAAEGSETSGVAEGDLYSLPSRKKRMIITIVVGVVAGTFCLMVPGPHMLGAWIPPLLGIWLGLRAGKTRAKVFNAAGPCPACGENVQFPGGAITDKPLSVPCTKCRAMVGIDVAG